MQLQPVRARWIFDEPHNASFALPNSVRSLWHLFEVVELKLNHRQGDNKEYADILNRIRFGEQTDQDLQTLKSRVCISFPQDSVHLFGKNKDVNDFNNQKLTEIPGQEYNIEAKNLHPARANFNPNISADGRINDTPFLNNLKIKEGARIMLTYNIDTAYRLTNGALGQIVHIVVNNSIDVRSVMIKFDNPEIGKQLRQSKNLTENQLTPISRISFSYSLGNIRKEHSAPAKVIQFPLKLAWAVTVHKFQGQTVKPPVTLVGHMESMIAKAQAYVLLGRVQSLEQLFLTSCSDKMIKVSEQALEEARILEDRAINNSPTLWMSKTWTISDKEEDNILDNYTLHCSGPGRGKGVAIYARKTNNIIHLEAIDNNDYQLLHLRYQFIDITVVYISPAANSNLEVSKHLKMLLRDRNPAVVCGDFNVNYMKTPNNVISKTVNEMGFQQLITESTYIEGSLLDHMYTNEEPVQQFIHPLYFSDHDATCLILHKEI